MNGEPLANTRVALADRPSYGRFKEYAETAGDGSFVFWGPPLGKWGLFYAIAGRRDEWVRVQDVQITSGPLDLGTIDYKSVKVTVQFDGVPDEPAGNLSVSFQAYDPNSMYALVPPQRIINPLVFDHVRPGRYELISNRPSGIQVRLPLDVSTAEPEQTLTVKWPRGTASLSGELGAAARKVLPIIKSKDGRILATLRGDGGSYHLDNLPAGDYFVTDQFVRDPRPIIEFSLQEGEQKTLDLTPDVYSPSPTDRGMLALRVFTPQGVPLTGSNATLSGSGGELQPGPSSGDGEVHFIGPTGRYRLTVGYPGFQTVERDVELKLLTPGAWTFDEVAVQVFLQPTDAGSPTN